MKIAHLNALRAFEATLRLGSYRLAVDEIGVSPEAIGQLVRKLEDYVDTKLFFRSPGKTGIEPTKQALLIKPKLHQAIQLLSESLEQLHPATNGKTLTVTISPSFTTK